MVVWTIGHSTRSLPDMIDLLAQHRVVRLADVRRFPRSRRHPQFDAASLACALPEAGIAYRHHAGLGGFRTPRADSANTGWRQPAFRGYADYMQTSAFAAQIDSLLDEAGAAPTAVMCAEALPSRCHRGLLADALLVRGVEVRHILGPGRVECHTLTADARVVAGQLTYPGEAELFDRG